MCSILQVLSTKRSLLSHVLLSPCCCVLCRQKCVVPHGAYRRAFNSTLILFIAGQNVHRQPYAIWPRRVFHCHHGHGAIHGPWPWRAGPWRWRPFGPHRQAVGAVRWRPLAVGCWLCWLCWLLAVGCWLLAVGLLSDCSMLAVGCWLLAVQPTSLITRTD